MNIFKSIIHYELEYNFLKVKLRVGEGELTDYL